MEFQVLGPVALRSDGLDLPLGGPQQRLVLARLITADGAVVSADRLIDDIWGVDPPPTAKKTIQGYVHHLRTQVGERLRTERAGYALETGGAVDAVRFSETHDAATAEAVRDPRRARDLLVDALQMWRGPAFADLRDYSCLIGEIGRLEEHRTTALGDRIDADLAVGRHRMVVGELDVLTTDYPLDERFRRQHMLALYGAGRHVEALRSFERFRRLLRDELGLDPSEDLRRLEHQILNHDVEMKAPAVAITAAPAAVRGYELREMLASAEASETYRAYQRGIGREVIVRVVGADVADAPAFIAGFARSAQRVAALDHPNIRHVLDTWREPGAAYLVSRWLDGGSMHAALGGQRLDWTEAFGVLELVGDALTSAHERGVPHGRVHARNVLFDGGGHPYLADFSIPPGSDVTERDDRRAFARMARMVYLEVAGDDIESGVLAILERACGRSPEHETIDGLLRAVASAAGLGRASTRSQTDVRNPYKGLHAFQEVDANDFFGRDDVVERLHMGLDAHRLVAAVGPSGSGKSSVVRAGLLPRLRDDRRLVATMYPGADPFEELAGALRSVGRDDTGLLGRLISGEDGLHRALVTVLPTDRHELLLVVDQLEELFSAVEDPSARALFLDTIVDAVTRPDARLRVVLTLRADFFDRPLQYPRFGRHLERGLVPVTTPTDAQMVDAIVEPAQAVGIAFEPGLPALMIDDVRGEPGGLPLLQHTLTELFERRTGDTITFESYMELGGVGRAVGRRAEEVYEGLPAAGQRAIRPALLQLVTVDDDAHDLRRRVRLSELRSASVDPAELEAAISALAAERLLTIDRDPLTRGATVEVAHEALLREWPRLRVWIEEQRDDLVTRRRMHAALAEWTGADHDESYLPEGGRLDEFRRWARATPLRLTADERTFLEAAEAHAAAAEEARREQRARELRSNRRLRRLVRAVVVVAVLALVAGAIAFVQRGRADREAAAAEVAQFAEETRRLVAEAPQLAATDRRIALLLAAEAYDRDPGPDTLGALQSVLVGLRGFHGYVGAEMNHAAVDWLAEDTIVTAHADGVTVFDTSHGEVMAESTITNVHDVVVDHERELVAIARGDQVVVLDAGLDPIGSPVEGPAPVTALAFAPDGHLAVGFRDGTLRVVVPGAGTVRWEVAAHPERSMDEFDVSGFDEGFAHQPATFRVGTEEIAFSADGRTVVTSGLAVVRFWDADSGSLRSEFLASRADDFGRVLSPPLALFLATTGNVHVALAGSVVTFRADGDVVGERPLPRGVPGVQEDVDSVTAYELDDDAVITATTGGTLRFVPLDPDGQIVELNAQLAGPPRVAASPDRRRVAFAARDGVAVMAFDGSSLVSRVVPMGVAAEVTISEDGDLLASSSVDRRPTEFYDLSGPVARRIEVPTSTEAWFAWVFFGDVVYAAGPTGPMVLDRELEVTHRLDADAIFTPMNSRDGSLLAFNRPDDGGRIITVYDGRSGERLVVVDDLLELDGGGFIRSLDFSPDASRLIATDEQGAALVWETADWSVLMPVLSSGGGAVVQAKFTPDGTRLVTLSEDGDITIRDADSLQPIGTLLGNTDAVAGLSHGPFFIDDQYMITTADGSGRLWDLDAGASVGSPFPSDAGTSPNASMSGRWLVTIEDSSAIVWELDLASWPELACRVAGRGMTIAEWEAFGPSGGAGEDVCTRHFRSRPGTNDNGS